MARGFNQVILQGLLARDPEIRDVGEGERRTRMWQATIANEDVVVGNDGQTRKLPWYHRVTVMGKSAEFLEQDGHKQGDAMMVIGSLDYRKWDDKDTGAKRSAVDVKGLRVERAMIEMPAISDAGGGMRGSKDSINEVTIIGNISRDPEVRYTNVGDAVITFGMAVNESWNDRDGQRQERTHWIDVNAWRELAEAVGNMKKGAPLMVRGRLRNESWVDNEGNKRNATRVEAVTIVEMAGAPEGKRASGARPAPAEAAARPATRSAAKPASKPASKPAPSAEVHDDFPPDEDLPF